MLLGRQPGRDPCHQRWSAAISQGDDRRSADRAERKDQYCPKRNSRRRNGEAPRSPRRQGSDRDDPSGRHRRYQRHTVLRGRRFRNVDRDGRLRPRQAARDDSGRSDPRYAPLDDCSGIHVALIGQPAVLRQGTSTMRPGLYAFAVAASFLGATTYIGLVEQPARLALSGAAMLREWKWSNRRGTRGLSVFTAVSAILAYIQFK